MIKKLHIFLPILVAVLGIVIVIKGATGLHGHGPELQPSNVHVGNHIAIQRGAKLYVNYCMGCHSAEHLRYSELRKVGLNDDLILENFIFDGSKVSDHLKIAMPKSDAETWFGAPAPDLTLINRVKHGPDYVYTYLKSFYRDSSRPFGANNTVLKNAGMPHVLVDLQGIQEPVYRYDVTRDGHVEISFDNEADAVAYAEKRGGGKTDGYKIEKQVDRLTLVEPGSLTPEEYDTAVRDIATFLAFIGEPAALERKQMGIWVVLFLIVFSALAYFMKKSYWEDVH